MTSPKEWNPYSKSSCISTMTDDNVEAHIDNINHHAMGGICSISTSLLPDCGHYSELYDNRDIKSFYTEMSEDLQYRSTNAGTSKLSDKLTPEKLAAKWGIGIKTAKRTLKATTHRCIKTVGDLMWRFRTDKAHMHSQQNMDSSMLTHYIPKFDQLEITNVVIFIQITLDSESSSRWRQKVRHPRHFNHSSHLSA